MNNFDNRIKEIRQNIANIFKNNGGNLIKMQEDIKKAQLKQFSTRELMDELRRRGKTVGRKGMR